MHTPRSVKGRQMRHNTTKITITPTGNGVSRSVGLGE